MEKRKAPEPAASAKRQHLDAQQTLYVRNLNDKVNRALLRETLNLLFSTYGEVLAIYTTKKLRGQAHILFATRHGAARALAADGTIVFGKPLQCDYARHKSHVVEAAEEAGQERGIGGAQAGHPSGAEVVDRANVEVL